MDQVIEALRSGQQCDEDGVMCIVSRQACHEAADEIAANLNDLRKAQDLAVTLQRKHYPEGPDLQVFDSMSGVINQIDNMTSGMMRAYGEAKNPKEK